jgi:hypothetical protein
MIYRFMSNMNKKFLIGAMTLIALFSISLILYITIPRLSRRNIPDDLITPRVVVESSFVRKSIFIENSDIGKISNISPSTNNPAHMLIIGETLALLSDKNGFTKTQAHYDKKPSLLGNDLSSRKRYGRIDPLHYKDGSLKGFLVRSYSSGVELMNEQGKTIWRYEDLKESNSDLHDLTGGDLDGNGKIKYVATYLGRGIELLNDALRPLWKDTKVWASKAEIVDVNNDGKKEIVHDDETKIVVRDSTGKIIKEGDTGHYLRGFSLTRWVTPESPLYVLSMSSGKIRLFDFEGVLKKELDAPLSEHLFKVYGIPIQCKENGSLYFAVLAEYKVSKRSIIYIYNSEGTLVYQEVLPEACSSIAALSPDDSGSESILLGGEGKILQYKIAIVSDK